MKYPSSQAAIFKELLDEDAECMDDYRDDISDFQLFVRIMRVAGQRAVDKELRRRLALELP